MMKPEIKNLIAKARSQQKQWARPSNQTIEDLISALESEVVVDVRDTIMGVMLNDPALSKEVALTKAAVDAVKNVAKMGDIGYTSRGYSNDHNTSIQSASLRLKALFTKGYLRRQETLDMTGGIYYVYKVKEGLL